MTYAVSSALQAAIYAALGADARLASLVGTAIYDALPKGQVPEAYVSIGDERVRDASDQTGNGADHRFDVIVRTTKPGFAETKEIAAAISDALHNAQLPLARGRLVFMRFERAEARRIEANATREVVMRFRARVDDQ